MGCSQIFLIRKLMEVVLILNLVASNSGCEPAPVSVLVVFKSNEALSKVIIQVCSWLPEGSQVTILESNSGQYVGRNLQISGVKHALLTHSHSEITKNMSLTTLNGYIEDVLPEKNDGKGMAKIVILFSPMEKVDFLDGGWNLRRMTFVVTSKLSDVWTKIASDDKHIVQTPLNDSIKDTFKAVLCEDSYRLCDTDHYKDVQTCSKCQDLQGNLNGESNQLYFKDMCKYFKPQLSEPALATVTVSSLSVDTTMAEKTEKTDPRDIVLYVLYVAVSVGVVILIIICLKKCLRKYNLVQHIKNRFGPSTQFPQQETMGPAVASICQEEGATLLSSVNENSDHDSLTERSVDTGFNSSEATLESEGEKKACAIPDTGPDNVALHEIVVENDAIAGPDMTDLKRGGRLQ